MRLAANNIYVMLLKTFSNFNVHANARHKKEQIFNDEIRDCFSRAQGTRQSTCVCISSCGRLDTERSTAFHDNVWKYCIQLRNTLYVVRRNYDYLNLDV